MKSLWAPNGYIVPGLFLLTCLLLLYAPFKVGILSVSSIKNNKDLIDSISKVIGIIILLLGSLLSYIRFFKGRVLRAKAELEIKAECFLSKNRNLYWLEIAIINKGSISILDYHVFIHIHPHPLANRIDASPHLIQSSIEYKGKLVDVGETAFEHAVFELDKQPTAYTFEVSAVDRKGTLWRRCLTIKNL